MNKGDKKQILFRIITALIPICFIVIVGYYSEKLLKAEYYQNYLQFSSIDLTFKKYWESQKIQEWFLKANSEAGLYGIRGGKEVTVVSEKQRILCIGDSFTHGFLLDIKETFPYLLEKKLGKESFEVLNAGYPGLETTQEFHSYKTNLHQLESNIVILQHYANDIEVEYYWKLKKQKLDRKYEGNLLYQYFYTFRFICAVVDNFVDNYSTHLEQLYTSDSFLSHANVLLEFKQSVEKNGSKFILLLIPSISYEKQILQAKKAHAVMVTFCKNNNIDYIDPTVNLLHYKRKEIILNKYDIHFNGSGNQIIADTIFSFLRKSALIAKKHPE